MHAHVRPAGSETGRTPTGREARQTGRDMLHGMGRDRTRVLICAAASLVLIVAAALAMDWYRVAFDVGVDEVSRVAIAIDLRNLRTCTALHVCTTAPLSRGWAIRAVSISPGSTRKPLTLTCASIRPRNSRSPDRRQRTRSPVLYRRPPASLPSGSGRKRSAVRSG